MSSPLAVKKRLYTMKEATEYLGLSIWSVRRLRWSGRLPSVRVQGRILIDLADMDRLIEEAKVVEKAPVRILKGTKVGYGPVSAQG